MFVDTRVPSSRRIPLTIGLRFAFATDACVVQEDTSGSEHGYGSSELASDDNSLVSKTRSTSKKEKNVQMSPAEDTINVARDISPKTLPRLP